MEKALDRMRRLCSRREYCVSDVRGKLMKILDGDLCKVDAVLKKLIDEKYVCDLRYATAFARDKASIAGWGDTKIRFMLAAKCIDRDVISEALSEVDEVKSSDRLVRLLEYKYRTLREDPQWKLKLLRFAMGRGYSYDKVCGLLPRISMEQKDDEEL